MRRLSSFVDTDFSRALVDQYGHYLQRINLEVRSFLAASRISDHSYIFYSFLIGIAASDSTTADAKALAKLGILLSDDFKFDTFKEILNEYS